MAERLLPAGVASPDAQAWAAQVAAAEGWVRVSLAGGTTDVYCYLIRARIDSHPECSHRWSCPYALSYRHVMIASTANVNSFFIQFALTSHIVRHLSIRSIYRPNPTASCRRYLISAKPALDTATPFRGLDVTDLSQSHWL